MPLHRKFPLIIIPEYKFVYFVFILSAVLLDISIFANPLYSVSNDSKNSIHRTDVSDAENISNTEGVVNVRTIYNVSDPKVEDSSTPATDLLTSSIGTSRAFKSTPQNKTGHWERTFDVASWLPEKKTRTLRGGKINLAIIPVLALLFFITVVCLKVYAWFRDSYKEKELEIGYRENYFILSHGDEEYTDVDLRSDSSVLYDTVSSYTSFRSSSNYNTWNSVRSVQVVQPPDMQALYKAFLLQRKGSISSSKGFTKKPVVLKDVEVQVELMSKDSRKLKPSSKVWYTDEKNTELENGFVRRGSDSVKNTHSSDAAGNESHNAANISERKSVTDEDDGSSSKCQKKHHRFKVSFVTDDCGNVVSSSRPNSTSISTHLDSTNHSPSSILTHSTLWSRTPDN